MSPSQQRDKSRAKARATAVPEFKDRIDRAYTVCSFISCFFCKEYSYFTLFDLAKLGYEIPYEVFYHPNATSPSSFKQLTQCLTLELQNKLKAEGWEFVWPYSRNQYVAMCPKCNKTFVPIEELLGEQSLIDSDDELVN
jgi:hypothetical protein